MLLFLDWVLLLVLRRHVPIWRLPFRDRNEQSRGWHEAPNSTQKTANFLLGLLEKMHIEGPRAQRSIGFSITKRTQVATVENCRISTLGIKQIYTIPGVAVQQLPNPTVKAMLPHAHSSICQA